MKKLKELSLMGCVKAQTIATVLSKKLKDDSGNGEISGGMILILIAVVVGGVLLSLFNDTVKSMWQTIGSKIADMFNYS